jgi:hypothetical protein
MQRLGRATDRGTGQVDGPVQVEQGDIVDGIEGFGAAAGSVRAVRHELSSLASSGVAGAGPGRLAWRASSLARSVARTERRASV